MEVLIWRVAQGYSPLIILQREQYAIQDLSRLTMSLKSGLQAEVRYALDSLLIFSHEGTIHLQEFPDLLNALVRLAGGVLSELFSLDKLKMNLNRHSYSTYTHLFETQQLEERGVSGMSTLVDRLATFLPDRIRFDAKLRPCVMKLVSALFCMTLIGDDKEILETSIDAQTAGDDNLAKLAANVLMELGGVD
ncbi:hypothetical protein BSLG_001648 [Batrachochytrium salamandrivorans]|nr:hypothetical protein BSLG_001648 [Batrachochytrium salamandrivorans]